MFPFHKLYLKVFHSLDFNIEEKILLSLQQEGINSFLIIKRSWIYGLKISVIILIIALLLIINAYISYMYFDSVFMRIFMSISFLLVAGILVYDTFSYLIFYKKTHGPAFIESDSDLLIKRNKIVNKYFVKFFNLSVFANIFLFVVFIETIIFSVFFYQGDKIYLLVLEIIIMIITSFFIIKHRRLAMDLELDFGLVVPEKFYVINQKGLLSSQQIITAVNIKTIEGLYNNTLSSLLGYGDIKIFLEGNIPLSEGMIKLNYIKNPRKTVDLINKVL